MNSNQGHHGQPGGAPYDREREMDERHRVIQQHEEMARRDQERERERDREREAADRFQSAHQSSAGSIPIHQPVASRVPGAIHSPGGLLANHNGNATTSMPIGGPSAPMQNYGGPPPPPPPSHAVDHARSLQHGQGGGGGGQHQGYGPLPHTQPAPQGGTVPPSGGGSVFGGPLQQQQPPPQDAHRQGQPGSAPMINVLPTNGPQIPGGITQGQQPILNDALTYLDQVKVQFHDQPDVYNRFLDIMKDFKSQAIDTPGVINRVSELFAGHPNLIQGFNTFLPPGYRIECGAGNDPNTIRVTTPMGTTVQSIAGRAGPPDGHGPGQPLFPERGGQWSQRSPEANFNTPVQNGGSLFVQAAAASSGYDATAHRAGSQVPGPAGANSVPGRSTPGPATINGAIVGQAGLERRGPVEFNHAISYVNKIKNRFQDKPEIYKQFLEILQTYQREQKPIQDVYAQVTTLFNAAPDLLEDFKQFLPETAGQAKATNNRAEEAPPAAAGQPAGARDGQKMPPLGSFAPPASASKDKKRVKNDKQTAGGVPLLAEATSQPRLQAALVNGKRSKLSHARGTVDASSIEPTLTPVMPEPYPPNSSMTNSAEELAFFEKVKKFLNNRYTLSEFLKLCNLYSQNIIDRSTLYHKGAVFISASPDLLNFWKAFIGFNLEGVFIENRPAPPSDKISLSNCRGYGPSYRLLPKRERLKPCSGRDDLCNSVLNDQWASHPTWASEDSGFVAHRKNQFEEGLHRIEEERHDYDFYIEANIKCIQLLEPIAQQMLAMTPSEREAFHMPAALVGQSTSIFKRISKKIYGEIGINVVNDMYSNPFHVVPIMLARMKQKDEEWRFSQREWEKVWHAQTENMHLKSLDHMGILIKSNDKRNLTAKHLVDVIKTKHEEQRRERALKGKAPRHQFVWNFTDKEAIMDLLRLMMLYSMHNGQHSTQEKERILEFLEMFIPAFFDLSEDVVQERVPRMQPDSGEEELEDQLPAELSNGRSRRNGKKGDLLRGVLDPGRTGSKSRTQKEDSVSGSKETTPDVASANDEDMADAPDEATVSDLSNERWMSSIPKPIMPDSDNGLLDSDGELKADGFFSRPWYNFFCNQTLFVFFSILYTLYERLLDIKNSSDLVSTEIKRLNRPKPARIIGFTENHMTFFKPTDDPATFWPKTLELLEEYIIGEIDENRYQDVMRHYYLRNGWKLYTIQDLLKTLCRLALTCSSTDVKEKTPDLIQQYLNGRDKEETSYQTEISARKFAEKCVKDGDLFVVCWFPHKAEATVRWLQRDETTFYMDEMKVRDRWQYYISAFVRVEPTEGIERSRMQRSVMLRNLPTDDESESDDGNMPKLLTYEENLVISICLLSSKMVWAPGGYEYFVYDQSGRLMELAERRGSIAVAMSAARAARAKKIADRFVASPSWAADLSLEEMQLYNENYERWRDEGIVPPGTVEEEEFEMQ